MHNIGYYVNNHGTGHTNRLFCFIQELDLLEYEYTLYVFCENVSRLNNSGIFSNDKVHIVQLPTPNWKLEREHVIYHCLPTNYKEYFAPIVKTCIDKKITTFVSDLSVEVGMAVRLHVDKLVYILLHGERVDSPHQCMFKEADLLLVPFTKEFEDEFFNSFSKDFNLQYSGGFLKFQYNKPHSMFPPEYFIDKKNVLIILGTGGDSFKEDYIDVSSSEYNVVVLGKETDCCKSIRFTNPYSYLKYADVVVANAGDSIMHEIAYFNKPYICIPEHRPFYEQEIKAEELSKYNYAMTSNWQGSLTEDIQNLTAQKNKSSLIENDKARKYTEAIINL